MKKVCLLLFICIFLPKISLADEYTSSSFRMEDPVIAPSGYGSSVGFQLWSTVSGVAVGASTASGFSLLPGFLSFPFVSTPAVSTTAGDTQVNLTWSASIGYLGWTVGGYRVGQSTVSGGPYTYSLVGNVLSSNRIGLTNTTSYYFIIAVNDALGNGIATSTEVSSTPTLSNGGGGTGGGGGGGSSSPDSGSGSVIFSGRAYPLSKVSFMKDGQLALTTIAGPDSNFTATISGLSSGNYNFGVYGSDKNGLNSIPFSFPIYITSGVSTKIGGIFIAPTIAVDKSEVKKGDNISIFGQSSPNSEIIISVNSIEEHFEKAPSDKDGIYLQNFDTSVLEYGDHSTKSKSSFKGEISSFGNAASFIVGTKNVLAIINQKLNKCDLNEDGKCNLVDFSIAAFWYKRALSPAFALKEKKYLNGDGRIDLVDFSIMAYYWTG